MSITDELRDYATVSWKPWSESRDWLFQMCDRIDAEHQKAIRELNNLADASVLLPVDADGVPIRVGDFIRSIFVGEVLAIELRKDGWHVHTDQWSGHDFNTMHHVQSDSWERIIEDVRRRTSDYYCNNIPCNFQEMAEEMVARCNALCACTKGGDAE